MSRLHAVAMALALAGVLQGCVSPCRGSVCERPVSGAGELVIWWPPHMRTEAGPSAGPADYQVVPLEH